MNEHCSKTEQQKRAKLDQRNAKDIEPEEALSQWNKDGQGLIKEMKGMGLINSMRRGHATPKYHNATFSKLCCFARPSVLQALVAQCVGRSKAPAHIIYQEDLVNIYGSGQRNIYIPQEVEPIEKPA